MSYFSLRALTTHANEPQDFRGYWTQIHEIFNRPRGIIVDVNAAMDVAIFPSAVECQRTEQKGVKFRQHAQQICYHSNVP